MSGEGIEERLNYYSAMLSDPQPDRRWKAAESIGKLGDRRAVSILINALGDEDWRVRQKVAWALGNLGDGRAIQPLRRLMNDPSDGVQDMAQLAMEAVKRKMAEEGNE